MRTRYKSGVDRGQPALLPPRLDDLVGADNRVRAIDAYVEALDLGRLGFVMPGSSGGRGQPPYAPGDLLKLYLYGYLHRTRSSRLLAREARVNVEAMWLVRGLCPGYRTIGDFRAANAAALKAANRDFVLLCRDLGLFGGTLAAIDGSFFRGDASKASIVTKTRLEAALAALDRDIAGYIGGLDAADAGDGDGDGEEMAGDADGAGKIATAMARRAALAADLAALEASGQTQLSRTDPDARLLSKNGASVAGYNVQCAVDDRHNLIAASAVTGDGNDAGQLAAMAQAAREATGTQTVVADAGYWNGEELKACEDAGIEAFVPAPDKSGRLEREGRFGVDAFVWDGARDVHVCPAGADLVASSALKRNGGKLYRRFASRAETCARCPLRTRCLKPGARRREVLRWEHADTLDRHRVRMAGAEAKAIVRRRGAIVEHPFGTLKCRAGWRHFLVRGRAKVEGEWSLMALAYNFSRAVTILGPGGFASALAARLRACLAVFLRPVCEGARAQPA